MKRIDITTDFFDVAAKAGTCRLLAGHSRGWLRDQYLALADTYDAIDDALDQALRRERARLTGESDAPARSHLQ